jgi:hypothetical protein
MVVIYFVDKRERRFLDKLDGHAPVIDYLVDLDPIEELLGLSPPQDVLLILVRRQNSGVAGRHRPDGNEKAEQNS